MFIFQYDKKTRHTDKTTLGRLQGQCPSLEPHRKSYIITFSLIGSKSTNHNFTYIFIDIFILHKMTIALIDYVLNQFSGLHLCVCIPPKYETDLMRNKNKNLYHTVLMTEYGWCETTTRIRN